MLNNKHWLIFIGEIFAQYTNVYYLCVVLMRDKMNRRYDLKGREAFLQELEVFFQYKEEMLDEGFYSETEFGDAVLDTIFDFFEEAESE